MSHAETMNVNVLVVDEDMNARIIAETLLRTRGLLVCSVADGAEALTVVRRQRPAVVVLDLALSGMEGLEVVRHLRGRFEAVPLAKSPRIIAVTSREEPEVERFALRLGVDQLLRKPLVPAEFVAAVEQLLASAAGTYAADA